MIGLWTRDSEIWPRTTIVCQRCPIPSCTEHVVSNTQEGAFQIRKALSRLRSTQAHGQVPRRANLPRYPPNGGWLKDLDYASKLPRPSGMRTGVSTDTE
jgi:hypothetical protein